MWRIVVMLHLAVVSSKVSCSPSSPAKVFFSSMNLRNVLHWYPGNDTQQNVHFTVQYAIYGDRFEGSGERQVYWRVVQQCKDIEWTWCDLTNETQDLEQGYYARVRAVVKKRSSKWMVTERRFDPKSDTSFGPPLVSFVMEGNSAIFTLRGPMRYQPNNHNPEISMAILYPHMSYNLSVHNTRHNQTQYITFASSQYKYGLMEYDTEYCFSAKTRFLSMPVLCQPSAWHCITTPPDPVIGEMQKMVVGIVIPSLCLCMLGVSGYLLHRSMSAKGQKWPLILELNPQKSPPLTFCPENLNLILISVNNDDLLVTNTGQPDTTFQKPQPPIPILPDLLSYAPQRTSSSPEPDAAVGNDFSEVESMGYGFVGMAHDTEEEEIDRRFGGTRDERWEQQPEGVHLDGFRHRREGTRERIEIEEWREESLCSAEGYKPQANPYLSQTSTHGKTNTLKEIKTDMCKFAQAPTSLWVPTFIKEQSQTWRNPLFGKTEVDVMREQEGKMEKEEDRVCPGIFLKKDPNTGVFYIPLLLQIQTEKGREGESMEGMTEMGGMLTGGMDGVLDRGPGEGTERERVHHFSPYTTQHIEDLPTSGIDQYDDLPDTYVWSVATKQEVKEDNEDKEATTRVNLDPESRRLLLPEMEMGRSKEGDSGKWVAEKRGWSEESGTGERQKMVKEGGVDVWMGGEGKAGGSVMEGDTGEDMGVSLQGVFVRQASEEERETERESDENGLLTRWNLMISMDL